MGAYIPSKIKSYISTFISSHLCGPVKKILVSTAQVMGMNLLLGVANIHFPLFIKFYPAGDETIYVFSFHELG